MRVVRKNQSRKDEEIEGILVGLRESAKLSGFLRLFEVARVARNNQVLRREGACVMLPMRSFSKYLQKQILKKKKKERQFQREKHSEMRCGMD